MCSYGVRFLRIECSRIWLSWLGETTRSVFLSFSVIFPCYILRLSCGMLHSSENRSEHGHNCVEDGSLTWFLFLPSSPSSTNGQMKGTLHGLHESTYPASTSCCCEDQTVTSMTEEEGERLCNRFLCCWHCCVCFKVVSIIYYHQDINFLL